MDLQRPLATAGRLTGAESKAKVPGQPRTDSAAPHTTCGAFFDCDAMSRPGYLETVAKRVLVYDGAMGTSLQKLGLTAADFGGPSLEGCNDYLVISRPD